MIYQLPDFSMHVGSYSLSIRSSPEYLLGHTSTVVVGYSLWIDVCFHGPHTVK